MSSPSETASAHQAGPADDRNRSEPSWHPADAIPEDDPRSPVPAAPEYPFVNVLGSAAAEPDLAGPDDAAAPFSVSPASPAAGPGSAPAAPVARDGTSRSARWQAIQSMFVDDPRSSLELAAGLVGDSVESIVMSVKEQQHSLLSAWHGDDAGTEELRTALRQYRAFWNRLEDFSRDT